MSAALSQGAFAFILLLAGAITLVGGAVLIRALSPRRRSGDARVRPPPAKPPPRDRGPERRRRSSSRSRRPRRRRAARARCRWRRAAGSPGAAAVYAGAGLVHAAVATVLLFLFAGLEFYPWRTGIVFWAHAWPVVLVLNLAWGPDRSWQVATIAVYVLVLVLLGLGVTSSGVQPLAVGGITLPALVQPLFLWLITAAPGVFLLVFLNRPIRSIGPLLLIMMLIAVAGAQAAFLAMYLETVQRLMVELAPPTALGIVVAFFAVQVAGFVLFLLPGWWAAAWLRRRYEAKRISDQTITFDAVWLLMTLIDCSALASERGALGWAGLLAFAAYRLVVTLGLKPLHRAALARAPARLLLLRVFGAQRQSERLFDLLGARWRYRGSLQLIAGTDLATTTLEPHEFLDFLSGRLARNFIHGPADLERRMAELDLAPDPDGRFRVNEFFCDASSWQMAVARLMAASDLVVMDLRGFSDQNRGCLFELQALIDNVPIDRLILLIGGRSDFDPLRQTLRGLWQQMRASSPNARPKVARLRLLPVERNPAAAVRRLLDLGDRILAAEAAAAATIRPVPGVAWSARRA